MQENHRHRSPRDSLWSACESGSNRLIHRHRKRKKQKQQHTSDGAEFAGEGAWVDALDSAGGLLGADGEALEGALGADEGDDGYRHSSQHRLFSALEGRMRSQKKKKQYFKKERIREGKGNDVGE